MNISVCTDIMYKGMTFSDKVNNIKENGFNTIEFWKWSDKDSDEVLNAIKKENMKVACFCVDSKDKSIMSKIGNCMLNSEYFDELRIAVLQSVDVAKRFNANSLIVTVGDDINEISYDNQIKNVIKSINYIKDIFEENNMILLIEPINRQERAAYLTPDVKTVIDIVKKINSQNVKVLYDVYHQEMENDFKVCEMIEALPYIGHIHVADVPGRHEPATGTIDYKAVFEALKKSNYQGFVGAEFVPEYDEVSAFKILKSFM